MSDAFSDRLSAELVHAGYAGLFQAGEHDAAPALWRDGESRTALMSVVRDGARGDLARVLAAELLFRFDPAFPPAGWDEVIGDVYARALALTGTGNRPIVLTGNAWGFLYESADHGALAEHLLTAGAYAVPHLLPLLDDRASIFYEGSQDAMRGYRLAYRVKDAAAYFLGRLTGIAMPFHPVLSERDANIERLKAQIACGSDERTHRP